MWPDTYHFPLFFFSCTLRLIPDPRTPCCNLQSQAISALNSLFPSLKLMHKFLLTVSWPHPLNKITNEWMSRLITAELDSDSGSEKTVTDLLERSFGRHCSVTHWHIVDPDTHFLSISSWASPVFRKFLWTWLHVWAPTNPNTIWATWSQIEGLLPLISLFMC